MLDQRDQFEKALGKDSGGARPWPLPMFVQTALHTNPQFVGATLKALFLFDPEFPLLYARVKQLRGELPEAIEAYMKFRLAEQPLTVNKKAPIPPDIQHALDMYATYFLALDHLDQGNAKQAERFFGLTLKLLPAPGRGKPYYYMFRWGAQMNLGLLNEAKGDTARAVAYFAEEDPTSQHQGNLVRARDLIWHAPTQPLSAPLAPPPPEEGPAP
jgi:hypothetical protein